jgi:hypothetical protein
MTRFRVNTIGWCPDAALLAHRHHRPRAAADNKSPVSQRQVYSLLSSQRQDVQ